MEFRKYLKSLTKKNKDDGTTLSDEKLVSDEVKLIKTYLETQKRLDTVFLDENLKDGINWIMGHSNYINQTFLKEKPITSLKKDYEKGSIVYVDFYGHFGNELTYDHPAIVLAESGQDLIIAPITTSLSIYNDEHFYHISLPERDSKLGDRPSPCTIKLEQMRFISKKRILINFKSRVSDNKKLKEIDIAIMKLLAEVTFKDYEAKNLAYDELKKLAEYAEGMITNLLELNETLNKENEELINQNGNLEEEIQNLKIQLNLMETENRELNENLTKTT